MDFTASLSPTFMFLYSSIRRLARRTARHLRRTRPRPRSTPRQVQHTVQHRHRYATTCKDLLFVTHCIHIFRSLFCSFSILAPLFNSTHPHRPHTVPLPPPILLLARTTRLRQATDRTDEQKTNPVRTRTNKNYKTCAPRQQAPKLQKKESPLAPKQ